MNDRNPLGLPDQVADDFAFGRQYGLFDDDLGISLEQAVRSRACDEVVAGLIHGRVQPLRRMAFFGELAPFRRACPTHGGLYVHDLNGKRLSFSEEVLPKNTICASGPGGGKSMGLCHFGQLLAELTPEAWFSDGYKKDLRELRPVFLAKGKQLIILRQRDWRFNFLQAGPRKPEAHLRLATDLLDRVLKCPDRGRMILAEAAHGLYRDFGNFESNSSTWPTLHHLYERIYAAQGLNSAARDAVLDRLGALIPAMGPPYLCGWDPQDLVAFSIVFELLDATEAAKELFLSAHLFSVLHQVYAEGAANHPFRLLVAFDDCQRIVSQSIGGGQMPTLEEYLTINRGGGIGVWLNLQTLEGVPRRVLATCGNKIMGLLDSHSDYVNFGADMGMMPEQVRWAELNLTTATFVARIADDRCRNPFPFRIPRFKVPKTVDEEEAGRSIKPLLALPTVPAKGFEHWAPHHAVEISCPTKPSAPRLSAHESAYLNLVIAQPNRPSSFYARATGLNGQRAAQVRQQLIAGGFVREHTVALGVRGRSSIILEPLEPAVEALAAAESKGTP